MTKRPAPTSGMTRPTLISNIPGKKPGAAALAALGWLSTFAVLWLWALGLMATDWPSIQLLMFSLVVAILAPAVASAK